MFKSTLLSPELSRLQINTPPKVSIGASVPWAFGQKLIVTSLVAALFTWSSLSFAQANKTQAKQSKNSKNKKIQKKGAVKDTDAQPSSASDVQHIDPIAVDKNLRIEIPKHLQVKGQQIRVRNLTTGREAVLTIADEEFISSDVVRKLTDSTSKLFVPEFSVLETIKRQAQSSLPADPLHGSYRVDRNQISLYYDQPIWRPVPFALQKLPNGATRIYIDTKQSAVVLSPQEAAARRDLKENAGIKRLFDVGFKALAQRRYDLSLEAFDRIMKKKDRLSEVQLRQAALGRGLSRFHQQGCSYIEEDFKIADQDPKNFDDVSYFRALCYVEAKRFEDAGGLFRDLTRRQSPVYGEQARFYLGVVAENLENYDEAESAYLDTIDFASDERIVVLAKERVELVRRMRADRNYENKWFSLSLVGAMGYDSNVVSLPQGIDPSAYTLSKVSSLTYLGVGSFEFKPRIIKRIDNRYRYTFVYLHYQEAALAKTADVQSHDGNIVLDYVLNAKNSAGLTAGYNSVFLGPIKTSSEYMATTSGEIHWSHLNGDPHNPPSDFLMLFKFGLVRPRVAAADPTTDSTANSYLFSWRYNSRRSLPTVWGPGLDLEYRPSRGAENSYASVSLVGNWAQPVGSEKLALFLSHEGAIQDSYYYERSSKRNDYVFRYTAGISRVWWQKIETKLQFIGTMSFSNVSTYRYNKAALNFLVSSAF